MHGELSKAKKEALEKKSTFISNIWTYLYFNKDRTRETNMTRGIYKEQNTPGLISHTSIPR